MQIRITNRIAYYKSVKKVVNLFIKGTNGKT